MHWWFIMRIYLYTSRTLCHILLCIWSIITLIISLYSTLLCAGDCWWYVNTCRLHLPFRSGEQCQLIPSDTLVTTDKTLMKKTPLTVLCNPAERWNTITHIFNENKARFTLRVCPALARVKLTIRDLKRILALIVLASLERRLFCFKYAPVFKNKYVTYAHYIFGQISVEKYPCSFEVPLMWSRPMLRLVYLHTNNVSSNCRRTCGRKQRLSCFCNATDTKCSSSGEKYNGDIKWRMRWCGDAEENGEQIWTL
jgi:hypothetical protein